MNKETTQRVCAAAATFAAVLALSSCGSSSAADAESYPDGTIRFISPYAAGGSSDQLIRPIADGLAEELGTEVVIEYKEGGSGALGTSELIGSEPDGYTIGYGTAGTLVSTPLSQDVGYSHEDVDPLGIIAVYPSILAVGSTAPYQSAQEFFDYAKQNPNEITVGVSGASTPMGIEMERLEQEHGIDVRLVPFQAQTEVVAALLGGNIDATFNNLDANIQQLIEEGEVTPIITSTAERSRALPDVPTFVESGYDLTLGGSTGALIAPKGMPEEVTTRLTTALETILQDPEIRERVGEHLIPTEFQDGDAMRALLEETAEAYAPFLGQ